MTKEEFKSLMKEAGFKRKLDLAQALDLSYQSVNNWGTKTKPYPHYLKLLLTCYIKAKKYDELMKDED